ncbi:MAG: hypothetical protein ACTJHZ_10095 [Vagococcus sp.]
MKIKTKKQLNLSQLIDYIWDNDIKNECFRRLNRGPFEYVWVNEDSNIEFDDYMLFRKNDIFEIEIEEEITEDTFFKHLIKVTQDGEHYSTDFFKLRYLIDLGTEEVHAYIDGEYKLIWTHEKGLVE